MPDLADHHMHRMMFIQKFRNESFSADVKDLYNRYTPLTHKVSISRALSKQWRRSRRRRRKLPRLLLGWLKATELISPNQVTDDEPNTYSSTYVDVYVRCSISPFHHTILHFHFYRKKKNISYTNRLRDKATLLWLIVCRWPKQRPYQP